MRKLILAFVFGISIPAFSQTDTAKFLWSFPITDYMLDVSDSVKLVQVHLPGMHLIKDNQLGLLKGTYEKAHSDTGLIGIGRCKLIKGDYYYFTVNNKESGKSPKENDLVYTFVERPNIYIGQVANLAGHHITLQNVYDNDMYSPELLYVRWEKSDEDKLVDTLVNDIRFTGKYFLDNNPSMNVKVEGGKYGGKMVLDQMIVCTKEDLLNFFDYILARPRLYAGRKWKISEIFATWLKSGAPTVIK
ncbi:MAG TPA: hypothetical protein VLJ68_10890 [Chitinophagaceae bacterium]|nr:hypothetical protein [Chitinophagaceae bacterium]